MRTALLSLLCAVSSALAAPHKRGEYAVKDRHAAPAQWKQLARAPKEHVVEMRIGLKQHKFEELERQLYEVSDPAHERYGESQCAAFPSQVSPRQCSLYHGTLWLVAGICLLQRLKLEQAPY